MHPGEASLCTPQKAKLKWVTYQQLLIDLAGDVVVLAQVVEEARVAAVVRVPAAVDVGADRVVPTLVHPTHAAAGHVLVGRIFKHLTVAAQLPPLGRGAVVDRARDGVPARVRVRQPTLWGSGRRRG